jgi:hypothetical protein
MAQKVSRLTPRPGISETTTRRILLPLCLAPVALFWANAFGRGPGLHEISLDFDGLHRTGVIVVPAHDARPARGWPLEKMLGIAADDDLVKIIHGGTSASGATPIRSLSPTTSFL